MNTYSSHVLWVLPEYFIESKNGNKPFELIKDDRDYKVGDRLILAEFDGKKLTKNLCYKTITYVLRDCEEYGLKKGFVILGAKEECGCEDKGLIETLSTLKSQYGPEETSELALKDAELVSEILKIINTKQELQDIIKENSKDIDSEFVDIVNDNFWDLV